MPVLGPMGPAGFRRRGRRRGLIVGAAVGSAAARKNAAKNQANINQTNGSDNLAELEKLNQLKQEGIITQAEFDAKKKQLLGL